MNTYINYIDDATLYAILQGIPLYKDLKEIILDNIVLNIIDDYCYIPIFSR